MNVQDVIKIALPYLNEFELLETTTLGGTDTPTEQQTAKLNTLLACVNDIVETLALKYFPLKTEENINNSTGKVLFSSLTKPLIDIVKVVERHGFTADYAVFPTYFETSKGEITVIYNYAPETVDAFTDTLEVTGEKVTARIVALGVVSRYYLINGMYADAEAWQNMFERAILVSARPKNMRTIRKRRWM